MDLTPSQLTGASFRTVRKGYDPEEVDALLRDAASALEEAQQHATAMEARARAAVARLQSQAAPPAEAPASTEPPADAASADEVKVTTDEATTISRTLLLAQRTADQTVADAEAEAERIRSEAHTEAEQALESGRTTSAQMVEDARSEARRAGESERLAAANEVESLKARREFLLGDVDQLEQFLVDQRERLRGAARQIEALCDRVPAGLGGVSRPALSASDDDPDAPEVVLPPEATMPFADANELAEALGGRDLTALDAPDGGDEDDTDPDLRVDTGELDATQPVERVESEQLPLGDDHSAR